MLRIPSSLSTPRTHALSGHTTIARPHTPREISLFITLALLLGAVSPQIGFLSTAIWVVITMPCHELGHAALHWLSGSPAIPSIFITVATSPSTTFTILLTLAFPVVAYIEYRRGRHLIAATALAILTVQVYLSYVAHSEVTEQLVLLGGIGGEILWAPLFALLAYAERSDSTKRYVVGCSIAAAVSLGNAITTWVGIYLGRVRLPTGALLMDPSEGDLDRLMAEFSWTPQSLIHFYCGLSAVSLWLVLLIMVLAHDKSGKDVRVTSASDTASESGAPRSDSSRFRRGIE